MVSVNRTTTVAVLIQLFLLLVFALEAGSYRFSGITSRATARTLTASHFPVLHSVINGAEQLATIDLDGQKIQQSGISRTFFIETHGCQMNLADSDIARAVLLSCGFVPSNSLEEAELVLINTCAIRENAESKVWQRIKYFESIRKKHRKDQNSSKIRAIDSSSVPNDTAKTKTPGVGTRPSTGSGSDVNAKFRSGKRLANQYYPIIGVLGCMAERLKQEMLKDQAVDFIAGPDAYRELPSLLLKIGESLPSNETLTDESAALAVASMSKGSSFISSVNELSADTAVEEAMSRSDAEDNRAVANLHLSFSGGDSSLDLSVGETYSDITPVREDILSQDGTKELRTHAFVTITRGCDNHCAFCVVRSSSILLNFRF